MFGELAVEADVEFGVIVIGTQKPWRRDVQEEIYRIGREALLNAFRHSRAKRVELELQYTDIDVHMRVRDNGCGITPEVLQHGRDGHWGLAGMRERAARIGGLLTLSSSEMTGTEVELTIPSAIALAAS